jgi:hypothetical protein
MVVVGRGAPPSQQRGHCLRAERGGLAHRRIETRELREREDALQRPPDDAGALSHVAGRERRRRLGTGEERAQLEQQRDGLRHLRASFVVGDLQARVAEEREQEPKSLGHGDARGGVERGQRDERDERLHLSPLVVMPLAQRDQVRIQPRVERGDGAPLERRQERTFRREITVERGGDDPALLGHAREREPFDSIPREDGQGDVEDRLGAGFAAAIGGTDRFVNHIHKRERDSRNCQHRPRPEAGDLRLVAPHAMSRYRFAAARSWRSSSALRRGP